MGNLGRGGWRITALVGREVKRTFSEFRRISTGLPSLQACEAGCQDLGDLRKALACVVGINEHHWHGRKVS